MYSMKISTIHIFDCGSESYKIIKIDDKDIELMNQTEPICQVELIYEKKNGTKEF